MAATITVARPEIPPLVARTVLLNVPGVAPAVNNPELLIVPPATTDHTGVTGTTLPPASLATAVNCCVCPTRTVLGFGVTVMVATDPDVTLTVALPRTPRPLAWTVLANVPSTVPAVKRPVAFTAPPPATTDQVGANTTAFPSASLPTAVNCWVALIPMVAGLGVTTMDASAPAVTTTVAVAEMSPLATLTVFGKDPAALPAVKTPVPDRTIHTIIRVVVIIAVVIWLLRAFGLLGAVGGLEV